MTLCLKEALPAVLRPNYENALDWLADRVALNRERGGFHYKSDSDAGKYLAGECLARLKTLTSFTALVAKAAAEWV